MEGIKKTRQRVPVLMELSVQWDRGIKSIILPKKFISQLIYSSVFTTLLPCNAIISKMTKHLASLEHYQFTPAVPM